MLEKMHALVKGKDICVLATAAANKPHCSLMAYVTDDHCREIYMVTDKLTKKYSNLKENPSVCLLIDTRDENQGPRRLYAKALTVSGVFQEIDDETQKKTVRDKLLTRHPHLRELALQPDAEVFAVRIESFLLLEGPKDSFFEKVEST